MKNNIRWTWADLVSSYRFWGLISFAFIFLLASFTLLFFKNSLIRYNYSVNLTDLYLVYYLEQIAVILAIIPAWIASRMKSYQILYLFVTIVIFLSLVIYFFQANLLLIISAFFLIHVLTYAIILYIPAVIAGAINSTQFFALAYALFVMLKFSAGFCSPSLMHKFVDINEMDNNHQLFLVCIALVIVSILFLLPIKKSLFNEARQ